MQILDEWKKDIPQQFLEKHNIEVLVNAFARQLQEIWQVFDDMKTKLDIDEATGQNLDYVGTIIPLSRKEAGELAGINVTEPVISDERYRQYLRYKSLVNTNECTYYDLMDGLSLIWEKHPTFYYMERSEYPATIFLETPPFSLDAEDPLKDKTPAIKPAGVGLIYAPVYESVFDNRNLELFELRNVTFKSGVSFWGCYVFNGIWLLDGSVLLCQKRRYGLLLGLKHSQNGIHFSTDIKFVSVVIHTEMNMEEITEMKIAYHFGIDFWNMYYFDGSNGFNSLRANLGAKLGIRIQIDSNSEEIAGLTVTTKTSDHWFFDGSLNMDGKRMFNSIYRKEVME